MRRTSLSDIPFNENINDFGTERYVNGLIKFIEKSSAPITIALQGEWGSGKTSLMTRLKRELCSLPESSFIGISINTWEHSMMSAPETTVYKILAQLVKELTNEDHQSQKTFSNFLRGAGNFLYRGARESLKTIPGIGGMLAVGLEAANVPTQILADSEDNQIASLAELRTAIENSIKKRIAEEHKQGVIIFIDDLDRLNPPVAVEILELLKNVFTLENCIFVLAIDYDVVVKGLEPKYGKLTDTNEREFRSFFDKIIQVPFSLPVNSYRPMDFVLNALVEIGFLREIETGDPKIKEKFAKIVELSVGKNPRSIKRLINTLSLLDCIAQCGEESSNNVLGVESAKNTLLEKQLNFIVVAIQICYPKIYRLLTHNPAFIIWDKTFAHKEGLLLDETTEYHWEDIVDAACSTDKYLTQHTTDIVELMSMIEDILSELNQSIETGLKQVLDKSSVTGINTATQSKEFDKKSLIYHLHNNVVNRIRELRPDITHYQLKRNTGNGGIYIWYEEDAFIDVVFTPSTNSKGQITLRLWLDIHVSRPERMKGLTFEDIIKDECLAKSLADFDSVLTPLLDKSLWYFEGRIHEGQQTYFPSYTEELHYMHEMGWMSDEITDNPQYWINLDKPSLFRDPQIVDVVAKVLIANYDFRKSMKNWK